MSNVLVARETAIVSLDGESIPITAGVTRVDEGHPLAKHYPQFFEASEAHFRVETTRAVPAIPKAARG